jgi:hypothetical protein
LNELPFLEFARDEEGTDIANRQMYAEARVDQLNGKLEAALEAFERLSLRDSRPEPLLRKLQCQRAWKTTCQLDVGCGSCSVS